MTRRVKKSATVAFWSIGGILGIVVIGALASQIGGATLRGASPQVKSLAITTPSSLVRGSKVSIHWPIGDDVATDQRVVGVIRVDGFERAGTDVPLTAGQASVPVPCEGSSAATVIVRDAVSKEVLASTPVELLAAGRDCLNRE